MTIKITMFGRHYTFDYVKHAHMTCNNGIDFEIDAPKDGFIIAGTVKRFFNDALQYAYIQQLNNCDACIVTTSCVHSRGHFNATMRLISYDTLVCEVSFLPINRHDDSTPYMCITLGKHWNYSRTTVQHVYKFLRMFGIINISVSDMAKHDLKLGCGRYTYATYVLYNNIGKSYQLRFTDDTITDFALNNAQQVIDRMCK